MTDPRGPDRAGMIWHRRSRASCVPDDTEIAGQDVDEGEVDRKEDCADPTDLEPFLRCVIGESRREAGMDGLGNDNLSFPSSGMVACLSFPSRG